MSISSEITRINTAIADAYSSVDEKGGTLPVVQNSANLPDAIASIPSGSGFPSVFFYGDDLTSSGSVTMTGQGKTYNGVWVSTPRLPSSYQEVEYIETHGTEYIDTGVIISSSTDVRCDTSVIVNTTSQDITILGADCGSAYYHLTPYSNKWYYGTNGSEGNAGSYSNVVGTEYEISFNNNGSIIVNGTTIVSGVTFGGLDFSLTINTRGNRTGSFKYKYFKVYKGSTLIRDFVPCYRVSDNVIGMYDLVNGVFYDNDGRGTFGKGSNVTRQGFLIDKVKSFGTYTWTATQSSSIKTDSILIDAIEDYTVQVPSGRLPSGYTEVKL